MPIVQELSQQDKEAVEMQKQQTTMQLLDTIYAYYNCKTI